MSSTIEESPKFDRGDVSGPIFKLLEHGRKDPITPKEAYAYAKEHDKLDVDFKLFEETFWDVIHNLAYSAVYSILSYPKNPKEYVAVSDIFSQKYPHLVYCDKDIFRPVFEEATENRRAEGGGY